MIYINIFNNNIKPITFLIYIKYNIKKKKKTIQIHIQNDKLARPA